LIELLTVAAILGILAAIAITQVWEYRAKGYDAQAQSDLRNAMTAEEAYFAAKQFYLGDSKTGPGPFGGLPGAVVSDSVTVEVNAATLGDYTGTSKSSKGRGKVFTVTGSVGIIR
jgi:Tfp pilus assembly protein PilE